MFFSRAQILGLVWQLAGLRYGAPTKKVCHPARRACRNSGSAPCIASSPATVCLFTISFEQGMSREARDTAGEGARAPQNLSSAHNVLFVRREQRNSSARRAGWDGNQEKSLVFPLVASELRPVRSKPELAYVIRPAELNDAAEIARLAGELGYPAATAEISTRLKLLLGQPIHFIAVAAARESSQKQLLGWIAAEERTLLVSSPQIDIMGLIVSQAVRRQGVGHALIAAAEHWAGERGQKYIAVRSNTRRQESHPFYEGLGYSRKKSQHVYVKEIPLL